jgi:hypothetical protein
MAFKILLIVNSAPAHPTTIQDLCKHMKVAFIHPKLPSVVQLMEQGVITFKTCYLKKVFDMLREAGHG